MRFLVLCTLAGCITFDGVNDDGDHLMLCGDTECVCMGTDCDTGVACSSNEQCPASTICRQQSSCVKGSAGNFAFNDVVGTSSQATDENGRARVRDRIRILGKSFTKASAVTFSLNHAAPTPVTFTFIDDATLEVVLPDAAALAIQAGSDPIMDVAIVHDTEGSLSRPFKVRLGNKGPAGERGETGMPGDPGPPLPDGQPLSCALDTWQSTRTAASWDLVCRDDSADQARNVGLYLSDTRNGAPLEGPTLGGPATLVVTGRGPALRATNASQDGTSISVLGHTKLGRVTLPTYRVNQVCSDVVAGKCPCNLITQTGGFTADLCDSANARCLGSDILLSGSCGATLNLTVACPSADGGATCMSAGQVANAFRCRVDTPLEGGGGTTTVASAVCLGIAP